MKHCLLFFFFFLVLSLKGQVKDINWSETITKEGEKFNLVEVAAITNEHYYIFNSTSDHRSLTSMTTIISWTKGK